MTAAEAASARGGTRWGETALLGAALASVVFHVWLIFSGLQPALVTRPAHLALAIPFVFFFAPSGRRAGWKSWVAGGLGILACLYVIWNREALVDQYGSLEGPLQYAIAVLLLLLVLEMARRSVEPYMPAFAALLLLYGAFGQYLPGSWGHAGIPLADYLGTLTIAEGGIWGDLTGISAELVAPFLILGAFVAVGEAGKGFMSLATQLAGRYRAGTAKIEVLASALYGTISGSASANVAGTGSFTIPAMIRAGYPRSFAAAVEAVASTGGQIMPPVMGAGVFLMAELIRVPYAELMVVATLPAALFFATAWFGVDLFAVRLGLLGKQKADLPGWPTVARTLPFFIVPFAIMTVALALTPFTAAFAAAIATVVGVLMLLVDSSGTVDFARWAARCREAALRAAQQIAFVASIIICAGIITGVLNATGLGVKLTSAIVTLSGGELWAALLWSAIACILLGMELPTTAAYIICISVAGPALEKLGLPALQAHLFVFWYALLCTITPPVCGNVFIAAGIAGAPWLEVAFISLRLGIGLFIVPVGFIANPSLLELGSSPLLALAATVKVGAGLWLVSYAAIQAGAPLVRRAAAFLAGAALILLLGF
jgi:TRAP transporter 4TM/12TM fusion protein